MSVKKRVKAIDRFIAGCKTDGIYDDLNAACIMAGWDGLAGALTPLVGPAPTNSGFFDADLDRGIGLTGDGSSKYLDSNRASEEDDQDSHHLAVFQTNPQIGNPKYIAGRGIVDDGTTTLVGVSSATNKLYTRSRNSADNGGAAGLSATGLLGMSRSASDNYDVRVNSNTSNTVQDSQTPLTGNLWVFRSNNVGSGSSYDGTLSFYSIGSATDLALLDARVSTLMSDLRSIEESDFDADALTYIRAVEAADGSYLETDVKVAINQLVAGLKFDSLWDSIVASCLLCGPRTLAGALVPLRGDAPTAYGFVDGDYDREGLAGDGTSYLDSNRANDAAPQDDCHIAAYQAANASSIMAMIGAQKTTATESYSNFVFSGNNAYLRINNNTSTLSPLSGGTSVGLFVATRSDSSGYYAKTGSGSASFVSTASAQPSSFNTFVFANNSDGVAANTYDGTLSFYSIGTDIGSDGIAKLDSHITAYVTAIGAAL
jgi:hypothetical protein